MGEFAPGWYPTLEGQRYFDGQQWAPQYAPAQHVGQTVVVTGPNHVLHGILTFLTWPLCGGWGWVWLIVAMNNRKHVTRY